MNCKNTAQQLFNISEDIYKSFYHLAFLEVCRAYQKRHTVEGFENNRNICEK